MALEVEINDLPQVTPSFFQRDVDTVARDLIGTFIFAFDESGNRTGGMIIETEAYDENDIAAHCYKCSGHELPKSRQPMLFDAGHAYFYRTRWNLCLNFVCDREGFGSAVLLRALQPTEDSISKMIERRERSKKKLTERTLCSGPGVLCEALGLNGSHYMQSFAKLSLFGPPFDLRLGPNIPETSIVCGPRIRIAEQLRRTYPGKYAANDLEVFEAIKRNRRWGIKESPFLSKSF